MPKEYYVTLAELVESHKNNFTSNELKKLKEMDKLATQPQQESKVSQIEGKLQDLTADTKAVEKLAMEISEKLLGTGFKDKEPIEPIKPEGLLEDIKFKLNENNDTLDRVIAILSVINEEI